MDDWLKEVFGAEQTGPALAFTDLLMRFLLALVLGCAVAALYRLTQRGDTAATSPTFLPTLVMLCILLAMVTQVIGNSAALAFSLVGILSIVRFRTIVEDTRDTAFVIFAVVVGMATGVGSFTVAFTGFAVVGAAAVGLSFIPNATRRTDVDWMLLVRVGTGAGSELSWEGLFAKHCAQVQLLSTATVRQGASIDLSYKLSLKPGVTPLQFLNDMNRLEGIQSIELKRV